MGIEPRALNTTGKLSTTKLYLAHKKIFLNSKTYWVGFVLIYPSIKYLLGDY